MASIRRKARYRWEARIERCGTRISRTFRSRDDAEHWAARTEQLVLQRRHGIAMEAESTTLDEALAAYAEEVSTGKRNGYVERRMILGIRSQYPQLCATPLAQVRVADLKAWRCDMLQQMAPATFNRYRALLHHLYVVVTEEDGYEYLGNPVSKLRRAKEPPGRDRRVSEDEIRRLATSAAELHQAGKLICPMPPIIRFAAATGMRAGEIAALIWSMVDQRHGVIRLRGAQTKSAKARLVPLFPEADAILSAMRAESAAISGVVFPRSSSDAKAISKDFILVKRAANIPDVRFHDLRHEFTSRKVEDGWGLLKVQQMTGHSTATMVNRYAHLDTTSLAAEIRRIPNGPIAAAIEAAERR